MVEPARATVEPTRATVEPAEPRPALRSGVAESRREAAEAALLSRDAENAVASSLQALSAAAAAPDPRRIEEMAREMLRPLLRTWLDQNLPALVERLVRAEIERIARGPR